LQQPEAEKQIQRSIKVTYFLESIGLEQLRQMAERATLIGRNQRARGDCYMCKEMPNNLWRKGFQQDGCEQIDEIYL
jgi:hypothetical protein